MTPAAAVVMATIATSPLDGRTEGWDAAGGKTRGITCPTWIFWRGGGCPTGLTSAPGTDGPLKTLPPRPSGGFFSLTADSGVKKRRSPKEKENTRRMPRTRRRGTNVHTFLSSLPELKGHSKGLGHRQGHRLGLLGNRQGNKQSQARHRRTGSATSCENRK